MTIPITTPYFSEASRKRILEGIDEILSSGRLMMGPYTEKFETAFKELVGAPYALTVNTCTTALQICLQFADVAESEVLVPSGSFVTDISVVRWAGGRPVLVDMNPDTLSFDLDDLERKVTADTKAIIWVHLTGLISADYPEIVAFAKEHKLFLIEDCAHAHGATIDGRHAGSLADAGCFSFYPTKVITSGTGGMITTANAELVHYAKEVRLLGRDAETGDTVRVGNDWFMDEIRACVGYHQLDEIEENLAHRRAVAARYDTALRNQPGMSLLSVPENAQSAYYQYPVFLSSSIARERLIAALRENHDVVAKQIYLPTHQEAIFQELDDGTLKKTEETMCRALCLPMSARITHQEIDKVADALIAEVRALL